MAGGDLKRVLAAVIALPDWLVSNGLRGCTNTKGSLNHADATGSGRGLESVPAAVLALLGFLVHNGLHGCMYTKGALSATHACTAGGGVL